MQTPQISITADVGMEACARTGVKKDGLGRVAGALAVGGDAKEVAHQAPEGGPVGVALREVEGAWACTTAASVQATTPIGGCGNRAPKHEITFSTSRGIDSDTFCQGDRILCFTELKTLGDQAPKHCSSTLPCL